MSDKAGVLLPRLSAAGRTPGHDEAHTEVDAFMHLHDITPWLGDYFQIQSPRNNPLNFAYFRFGFFPPERCSATHAKTSDFTNRKFDCIRT